MAIPMLAGDLIRWFSLGAAAATPRLRSMRFDGFLKFGLGISAVAGSLSAAAPSGFLGFGWGWVGVGRFLVHLGLLILRVRNVDANRSIALQQMGGSFRLWEAGQTKPSAMVVQNP